MAPLFRTLMVTDSTMVVNGAINEKTRNMARINAQSSTQDWMTNRGANDTKNSSPLEDLAQGRLVEATPLVATTDYPFLKKISDHAAHSLSVVLNLEPGNF
ncbi:hypothetical protein Tco_0168173 [Tanacetum coccineum]